MSVDRSLHLKSSLERHRNVLSRAERVAKLMADERWQAGMSALALPKVAHQKAKAGKKKAAKAEAPSAAGTPAAAPAAEKEKEKEKK